MSSAPKPACTTSWRRCSPSRSGRRGLRLRQQHPRRRGRRRPCARLRHQRVRPPLRATSFLRREGPFVGSRSRGDPADIAATDEAVLAAVRTTKTCGRWITLAQERVQFQGPPSAPSVGSDTARAPRSAFCSTSWFASGKVKAPIVIGRDHLDCGSVASPNRETEGMKRRLGRDRRLGHPERAGQYGGGRELGQLHHGGGVGIGNSLHAGMVVVADGTREAAARLERVLTSDPGMGVIRHADAGYDESRRVREIT